MKTVSHVTISKYGFNCLVVSGNSSQKATPAKITSSGMVGHNDLHGVSCLCNHALARLKSNLLPILQ
jgi:hypothetical protein